MQRLGLIRASVLFAGIGASLDHDLTSQKSSSVGTLLSRAQKRIYVAELAGETHLLQ